MTAPASVEVSIEALAENQIQEIGLDGQETYVQPLSMSENLAKLAHRIDFGKVAGDNKEGKAGSEEDEEEQKNAAVPHSQWPWDSVRTKLRHALTETSVLLDLLQIVKQKHYMVLDPVQQESTPINLFAQAQGKKKALKNAGEILIEGAARLRKSHEEMLQMSMNRTIPQFHNELIELRRTWRLKKAGNAILGDLSFRSAGSRYRQNATFEVLENKEDQQGDEMLSPQVHPSRRSSLEVQIPAHLQGASYIFVSVQKDRDSLASASMTLSAIQGDHLSPDTHWQKKLEAAQNVLFCKEIFAQLSREAVQLKSAIPHMVISNQITSTLFPGIQLTIGLCHSNGQVDKTSSPSSAQKGEHDHILEHSLHQLLREMHAKNISVDMPHPACAMLGASKRRRLAGPQAFDRSTLLEMAETKSLLEQIIEQSQHAVLRIRSNHVLETITMQIRDPQMTIHWNALGDATHDCIKINITTHSYETCRTPVAIQIGITSIKVTCRDGRIINLSHEPQELRNVLLGVMSWHNISSLQSLAKLMSWQVLSTSVHLGLGEVEPLGNASSIIMSSPSGERVFAIRSGPFTGKKVYVQGLSENHDREAVSNVICNPKWNHIDTWQEINWNKIEGKNFLHKIELLMAAVTKC